uniref:HECT domain-containing protein n=1 Tax=Cyprinus carpio TaxID=7962 RepID=A0A8C2A4U8_CYPCA
KTPSNIEELNLLQAGMGRRTIAVMEDADHSWLSRKLEETYTKMAELKGAWMLYKAVGKMINFPIFMYISTLFIVPVQGALDLTPLPYSSKEFEKMAKATCHSCLENMPVQLLATACPICERFYPSDFVEIHASIRGESIADVIKILTERMDETSIFSICVTRDQMLERGLKQWQRQKKSSPKNPLRVSFIGEAGIDNGALRKEFLTVINLLDCRTIGELFAVSIAQDGPPPKIFMQWCYNYISTGEIDQEAITENDITDPELMELIKEIKAADNATLMVCTDRILSCGYTGAVSIQRREDIVRSVVLHATVRLLPMLQQICFGMKLYGLLSLVQQEADICRQLFVPGSFFTFTHLQVVNFLLIICYPVVNSCSCSVTFPVTHLTTYAEFKSVISQAIVHGYEFGRCKKGSEMENSLSHSSGLF